MEFAPRSLLDVAVVGGVDALLEASEAARQLGEYTRGAVLAEKAARAAERGGRRAELAAAQVLQARHLTRTGELERAVTLCRLAMKIQQQRGDDFQRCHAMLVEAFALMELGLHAEALESLGDALELATRLDDRDLLYWVHNRLGTAHEYLGDPALGRDFLQRALAMADTTDAETQFCVANNLAANAMTLVPARRRAGDEAGAEEALRTGLDHGRRAAEMARTAAHPYRYAISLSNMGLLRALGGDLAAARSDLLTAQSLAVENNYPSLALDAAAHLAELLGMQGRYPEAVDAWTAVLDAAEGLGENPVLQTALAELVNAYEQLGEFALALGYHRRVLDAERELRTDLAQVRARLLSDQVELADMRLESALAQARTMELEVDREALQQRADELYETAHRDALTAIGNRRYLDQELDRMLVAARAHARPCVVALADVDHFKDVNDTFGHAVGDEVLVRLGRLIESHSRPQDIVGRFGGEEFAIGLRDLDLAAAGAVCERLRRAVEHEPWSDIRPGLQVTLSFGLADAAGVTDLSGLLTAVDEQLYLAKAAGRNRVWVRGQDDDAAPQPPIEVQGRSRSSAT